MMSSTRRKGIGSLTVWVETEIKAVCEGGEKNFDGV